jgi:caffeoyl-CoA O-methyltransferase
MRQVVPAPVGRYLEALHGPVDPLLETVRAEGLAAGLPLVEPDTGRLLRSLVIATGAKKILEIGTAIGYSALWMAQALPPGGQLISLEIDPSRAATARANIERAGLATTISVIVGDASRFLHKVAGPFDLIFQDGDKMLYEPLLDRLVDHLRPGGVLVTDNVLWDGEVVEGFISTRKHDEASTAAICAYNRRLAGDTRLLTTFLPTGDGVAVSVKLPHM